MDPDATTDLPSAMTPKAADSATTLEVADSGTATGAPTAIAADDPWHSEARQGNLAGLAAAKGRSRGANDGGRTTGPAALLSGACRSARAVGRSGDLA
jgi:hypothetical protein